jgi:hypothetical protein
LQEKSERPDYLGKPRSAAKRIAELTKQREMAIAEAQAARSEVNTLRSQLQPQQQSPQQQASPQQYQPQQYMSPQQ